MSSSTPFNTAVGLRSVPLTYGSSTCSDPCQPSIPIPSYFPFLSPAGTSCSYKNLVYVLNTGGDCEKSGNHFCTLAFISSSKLIYIIGRNLEVCNESCQL